MGWLLRGVAAELPARRTKLDRLPVSSSNIASVGYDETAMILEVEFKEGRIYQYFDVPRVQFDGILSAGSPTGFLNTNIKPFYRYLRA